MYGFLVHPDVDQYICNIVLMLHWKDRFQWYVVKTFDPPTMSFKNKNKTEQDGYGYYWTVVRCPFDSLMIYKINDENKYYIPLNAVKCHPNILNITDQPHDFWENSEI